MRSEKEELEEALDLWTAVEDRMHLYTAEYALTHWEDPPKGTQENPIRGSWFVPCCSFDDMVTAHWLFQRRDVETVIDLGAGALRFSLVMDRLGYDVIAYEVYDELLDFILEEFDLGGVELRRRDYYRDFMRLREEYSGEAFVAFGGTNRVPLVPEDGVTLQGYFEDGVSVYFDGERQPMQLSGFRRAMREMVKQERCSEKDG